jgi:hypothetical protein
MTFDEKISGKFQTQNNPDSGEFAKSWQANFGSRQLQRMVTQNTANGRVMFHRKEEL